MPISMTIGSRNRIMSLIFYSRNFCRKILLCLNITLTSINVNLNTFCTSFIEMTSPTQTELMTFDSEGIRTFYNKFINAMAQILAQYNGKILKNIGDGLASTFPKQETVLITMRLKMFWNAVLNK